MLICKLISTLLFSKLCFITYIIYQGCGHHTMNRKIHHEWHHVCIVLKTNDIDSDTVNVKHKWYFDGIELSTGS